MATNRTQTGDSLITLELGDDQRRLIIQCLEMEWQFQAEAVHEEVSEALGDPSRRDMHLADAAWKVRRQALIVDLLVSLGAVD